MGRAFLWVSLLLCSRGNLHGKPSHCTQHEGHRVPTLPSEPLNFALTAIHGIWPTKTHFGLPLPPPSPSAAGHGPIPPGGGNNLAGGLWPPMIYAIALRPLWPSHSFCRTSPGLLALLAGLDNPENVLVCAESAHHCRHTTAGPIQGQLWPWPSEGSELYLCV